MDQSRKAILSSHTRTPEEFERLADLALELGFTHVVVSPLPKPRWQLRLDSSDPYPQWGLRYPSIFNVGMPEELGDWLSREHSQRCMELLAKRGEILKRRGLKAAFGGCDPMWFPEAAYQAHPEWRGPRCEHPARAKRPYHAPCIDHPEILAMYRAAVTRMCRAAPIELFELKANDSGAGICWSETLYPGPNGPEHCRHRSYAQRVVGFLAAIQDGARDAGLCAQVEINFRTTPAESEMAWPHLLEGQVVGGKDHHGRIARVGVGFCTYLGRGTGKTVTGPGPNVICATFGNYSYASHTYPVVDIPQLSLYAEQLQRHVGADADLLVYLPSVHCAELIDLVRGFRKRPFDCRQAGTKAIAAVAEQRVGAAAAPMLLEAWEHIRRAVDESLSQIQYGGPLFTLGAVSQRWLVRPLVPFPFQLTPDEKDYYRKHQFQARSEEQAADLMDLQGVYLIRGADGTRQATVLLDSAIDQLQAARSSLRQALPACTDAAARRDVTVLDLRLAALICVTRNAIQTAKYQEFLDRCGPTAKDRQPISGRVDGIPGEASRIIEADIENTKELIALLESAPAPLLDTASEKPEEDVFTLGPDLVEQLRKKIQLTLAHRADHRRL